jgi:hypothetical protein
LYSSADVTSPLTITRSLLSAPASAKVLFGDHNVLQVSAFLAATHGLPGYRYIWELAPWVVSLVGIGFVARSVSLISGRWAGMVVLVAAGCAGPWLLQLQFSWGIHAVAYQDICLFGGVIALLVLRGGTLGRSRQTWWLCLLLVTIVGAGGIADDELFAVGGLLPFVITAGVVGWLARGQVRKRIWCSAGLVTVGAAILSEVARAVGHHLGIFAVPFPLAFVQYAAILNHGGLLVESLVYLFNGNFAGMYFYLSSALAFACAALVVAAICVACIYTRRQAALLLAAFPKQERRVREPQELARLALIMFWSVSAVTLSAAFVFTSAVQDIYGMRYVVPVAYTLVVIIAVAAAPRAWARNLVSASLCLLVCSAAVGIFNRSIEDSFSAFPHPADVSALEAWARAEHVTHGYASYWDAAPLTWWMQPDPAVYPVIACGTTLCPYDNRLSSWYTPRAHSKSFVVVDNNFDASDALGVTGPPAALGRPTDVAHVGHFTVYLYSYDVASRFAAS